MTRAQTRGSRRLGRLPWLVALWIAIWPSTAEAGLRLEPSSIQIGSFFNGAKIRVIGDVPQGSQVVVEVMDKRAKVHLLRRGRHWHVWMTVGEVAVENAPSVYYALSTNPRAFDKASGPTAFGFGRLLRDISFVGDLKGLTHAEVTREFLQLKESQGLYGQSPGALKVTGSTGGRSTVEGELRLPSRVDSGTYHVQLSVLEQGRVVHTDVATFHVRPVGVPAFLQDLAQNNGSLYGILAVLVALVFGFGVGVLFKRGGKGGH